MTERERERQRGRLGNEGGGKEGLRGREGETDKIERTIEEKEVTERWRA